MATTPALADPAFHILLLASVLAPHDPAGHWEPSLQMTALLRGPSLVRKFGGRRYIIKLEKPLAWRSSETGAEKPTGKQPGLEMTVWPRSCVAHLASATWLGRGKGSSRTQGKILHRLFHGILTLTLLWPPLYKCKAKGLTFPRPCRC